jgi:2-polyprenyl-3-methyl-5-hydroxy-6-metoxy-1,4-benzoquinol methylase
MKSILFPGKEAELVRTIKCDDIIYAWKSKYKIDVESFFENEKILNEYKCKYSGLYFFYPNNIVGNELFYASLMHHDWYYAKDKWEHSYVLGLIGENEKVLEIGSGSGLFQELCSKKGNEILGIELNGKAALEATSKGLKTITTNLYDFAPLHKNHFDTIVAFQVLEHVPDPLRFIAASLACLKPNGKVIFSVPNSNSKLIRRIDILNMPPHHMLGWTAKSFKKLQELFPMDLERIIHEPLSLAHIDWFLNVYQQENFLLRQILRWKIFKNLCKKILKVGGRNYLRGHSHLAIFIKKN